MRIVIPITKAAKAAHRREVRKVKARTKEKVFRGYVGLVGGKPRVGDYQGAIILRCYLLRRDAKRFAPDVMPVRVVFG